MSKLTNEQKYETAEERVKAFLAQREVSSIATVIANEFARWLALEAEEEKPEPCPFCSRKTESAIKVGGAVVECKCGYHTIFCDTTEMAIAAHNRVARAVRAVRESEVK